MNQWLRLFVRSFLVLIIAVGLTPLREAQAVGAIIYVDADAAGAFDGTSWTDAYKRLQNALAVASSGDQIWVAEGIYYPDEGVTQVNNDPSESFLLSNGVQIYGGFNGTESLLSERNLSENVTILSGDIDKNDTNTDGNNIAETTADIQGTNSYHVVRDITGLLDSNAVVDGFVITAGYANGNVLQSHTTGGGIQLLSGSSPNFANLTLQGNRASANGGAFFAENSTSRMTSSVFMGNNANNGGGAYIEDGAVEFSHVIFDSNSANDGGGLTLSLTNLSVLTDVSFLSNTVTTNGGGMVAGNDTAPLLIDVTFTGNSAAYGGGLAVNPLANPDLTSATFNGNQATQGGGAIYAAGSLSGYAYLTMRNSTISGNNAVWGGAYYGSIADTLLRHVTVSGNTASLSAGGFYNTNSSGLNLINSIVGNSTAGDCVNLSGATAGGTNSLVEDAANACGLTNGVNGNIVGQDPVLGPLADNGGLTLTHELMSNSPAVNNADDFSCLFIDQRGLLRPNGVRCDMGSFEAIISPALISPLDSANLNNRRPTFDWADYSGALGYSIQVSRNSTFTQLVVNTNLNGGTNSTYTPTSDLTANTVFYWRVRSKLSSVSYSSWSHTNTFTTGNPPGTPSFIAPANNAVVSGPSPLFDWSDASVPVGVTFDYYQFQIATDATFSNLVLDEYPAGLANSQSSTAVLSPATTYYARVRSFAIDGDYSAWSATRTVKIAYLPPALLSPVDGSTVGSLRPAFTWDAVSGATGYTIQISRTSSFRSGTINANTNTPSYAMRTNLLPHTLYYWRVKVNGPYGPVYTPSFTFTTP